MLEFGKLTESWVWLVVVVCMIYILFFMILFIFQYLLQILLAVLVCNFETELNCEWFTWFVGVHDIYSFIFSPFFCNRSLFSFHELQHVTAYLRHWRLSVATSFFIVGVEMGGSIVSLYVITIIIVVIYCFYFLLSIQQGFLPLFKMLAFYLAHFVLVQVFQVLEVDYVLLRSLEIHEG